MARGVPWPLLLGQTDEATAAKAASRRLPRSCLTQIWWLSPFSLTQIWWLSPFSPFSPFSPPQVKNLRYGSE
jgi:hypothetical protein